MRRLVMAATLILALATSFSGPGTAATRKETEPDYTPCVCFCFPPIDGKQLCVCVCHT